MNIKHLTNSLSSLVDWQSPLGVDWTKEFELTESSDYLKLQTDKISQFILKKASLFKQAEIVRIRNTQLKVL